MNPEKLNEDNYLNSIKRFFLPFILLNIVAVVLGASVINIINLTSKSEAPSGPNNVTGSLSKEFFETEVATIASGPLTNLSEITFQENLKESTPHIYLPTVGSQSIQESPLTNPSAYPEPNHLPILPVPEDQFQYDQTVDVPKIDSQAISDSSISLDQEQAKHSSNIEIAREPETRQLILPTINVNSEIIDIPIVNGNWEIAQLDDSSGVLEGFSNHPTDSGALVIAAHATTNWPTAGPFAELRNMNLGDPIIFKSGTTEYVYEISRFLRVSTSDVNILNKSGEDGIVLVTCGSYNYFTGVYGSRLVVYGDLTETREVVTQSSN